MDELGALLNLAIDGSRGPDQLRIAKRGMEIIELLLRKNSDYGNSAWTPPILAPGMNTRVAIQIRMSDKISRLNNLLKEGKTGEVDESVGETMMDLAGYAILWLAAPEV